MKFKRTLLYLPVIFMAIKAMGGDKYIVSGPQLNMREKASIKSIVIDSLKSGDEIEVLSISKGWANIRYKAKTGYVKAKYIRPFVSTTISIVETVDGIKEVTPIEEVTSDDATGFYIEVE